MLENSLPTKGLGNKNGDYVTVIAELDNPHKDKMTENLSII